MPSAVTPHVSIFDRAASATSRIVSRAWFFAACVLLVFDSVDTWQLVINTATTIGTWLLVALLQNAQQRADQATQHKLNAIAQGLADLMQATADNPRAGADAAIHLHVSVGELRAAVGLEHRESS
jgi:low affinity Fe/Cu permease